MKNIVLLCSAGMSTSMLVTKMRAAAEAEGVACNIDAYGLSEASAMIPSAACVLWVPKYVSIFKSCSSNIRVYRWLQSICGCMDQWMARVSSNRH